MLRELEQEGQIGQLDSHYYVTTGNSTAVADSIRMGETIAKQLIDVDLISHMLEIQL